MKNVIAILRCYKVVSGLKVNLFKSVIIGIHAKHHLLHRLADIMGCNVGSFPTSYLGLLLSIGSVSKSLWNPVVERVEQKLASWKARYLSVGGRITLIMAAHANLPNYFMSIFQCPASVVTVLKNCSAAFYGREGKEEKISFGGVEKSLYSKDSKWTWY